MLTHLKRSALLVFGLAALTLLIGLASSDPFESLTEQPQPSLMAENGYQSGGG